MPHHTRSGRFDLGEPGDDGGPPFETKRRGFPNGIFKEKRAQIVETQVIDQLAITGKQLLNRASVRSRVQQRLSSCQTHDPTLIARPINSATTASLPPWRCCI